MNPVTSNFNYIFFLYVSGYLCLSLNTIICIVKNEYPVFGWINFLGLLIVSIATVFYYITTLKQQPLASNV
jgi:hypothetical protein